MMFVCKSVVDIISLGPVLEIWVWMDLRLTQVKGCNLAVPFTLICGQKQQKNGPRSP